jgi:hypothetical protein
MPTIELPTIPFESFQKISRANKAFGCVITEKLDGTNAQIIIENNQIVAVGSRSRWIKPGKDTDNYGFAGWVERNYEDLLTLGDGKHFGEWFGAGIQRAYGLTGDDKRFALFNTGRWSNPEERPACCSAVPVLYAGEFNRVVIDQVMADLAVNGSKAVPGFMKPEGIIIYLTGPRLLLKETFEFSEGKWAEAQQAA